MSLEREADVFARALTGSVASAYARAQYRRAHEHLPLQPRVPLDRILVGAAVLGAPVARIADAYARIFAPSSLLRRKLGVMTAILESSAGSDAAFAAAESGVAGVAARLALTGVVFALCLLAGVVLFGPAHLVSLAAGRGA